MFLTIYGVEKSQCDCSNLNIQFEKWKNMKNQFRSYAGAGETSKYITDIL